MTPEEKNNLTNVLFLEYVKQNNMMVVKNPDNINEAALKISIHNTFSKLKECHTIISNEVEKNF